MQFLVQLFYRATFPESRTPQLEKLTELQQFDS
jgi:hypothetical protein